MSVMMMTNGAFHPAERRVDDEASTRTRRRDVGGRGRSSRRKRGGTLRDDRTYCKATRRMMKGRMAILVPRSVHLH
jgi:hypothetical protein